MDLPVWQALYEELAPRSFTVITVAMDAGGAPDVHQWIEAAKPTHPSLIDTRHVVAELYDWVNVPSNAWIDEEGRIVRPNDPGFAGEYFRGMMDPDFDFKAMMKEYGRMRDRSRPRRCARGWPARIRTTRALRLISDSARSSATRGDRRPRRRRSPRQSGSAPRAGTSSGRHGTSRSRGNRVAQSSGPR